MAQSKIIYGFHAIMAALIHHPENILNLYCCQEKNTDLRINTMLAEAAILKLKVEYRTQIQLEKLTQSAYHQGVAATIRISQSYDENAIYTWLEKAPKPPLLLLLEGIQDPHNLGACLRSAEALGVDWVVIPRVHTAPLNATVSKVACGADQMLPVVEVSNLVRFIQQIQKKGVWVIGTSGNAELTLAQAELKCPIAIVMGTEGKGLKRLTLKSCDEVVKIPLLGTVPSLNVSVATGICLYECLRQRFGIF